MGSLRCSQDRDSFVCPLLSLRISCAKKRAANKWQSSHRYLSEATQLWCISPRARRHHQIQLADIPHHIKGELHCVATLRHRGEHNFVLELAPSSVLVSLPSLSSLKTTCHHLVNPPPFTPQSILLFSVPPISRISHRPPAPLFLIPS